MASGVNRMKAVIRWQFVWFAAIVLAGLASAADPSRLALQPHDHVILIGNTLAERMQYFGNFETFLHSRFPRNELYVRDLGWSADELTIRLRSQGFRDHGSNLVDHAPDVVIAMFGFNESFAGPSGIGKFEKDLAAFVKDPYAIDRYTSPGGGWDRGDGHSNAGRGEKPIRTVVLVSPIAHENLQRPGLPDGSENNTRIALYTESMRKVAAREGAFFVDLFTPSREQMAQSAKPWTINGIHLNEHGDREVGRILDEALFGPRSDEPTVDLAALRAAVNEKNLQFFYDHRGVNGCYIYGGRKNPYGTVNFPAEFKKLRAMTAVRDQRVWDVAQGRPVPNAIDDSGTGDLKPVETNVKAPVPATTPEESLAKMEIEDGYEVKLFASEVEFPELANPVQMTFDAKGRLWIATMPGYPQYLPGVPVNDKILIFEDTNGDGKADKQTVFADGLHLPTGLEIADGGLYVAQEPNLVFLKDTNGDDKADVREIVLDGFDSADSHHAIGAFASDPGGGLLMEEGTFHQTAVETIRGPKRCSNAGIFRYDRRAEQFDVFVSYGFANPWGQTFDRWGQYFVADASGGANYFGTAFSGDVDYPQKHASLKQFLQKQWRPTSGCEFVSSRQFPDDAQGNYLLNNCIGFQGILQYKMRDDGAGYAADPVDPLLKSNDPNFRPVDLEFGADGCLYVVDWYNPLVGHMQHSLRDPNRDHFHGRIWRVKAKDRPLVVPTKIAGEPTEKVLDALTVYEDRTRYRARAELRSRSAAEVIPATEKWLVALDAKDSEYQHHLVEALWVYQSQDVVNESLLDRLLASPEPKARAAATRVLCFWRDRVGDVYGRLRKLVSDEHPLVRLEAVRALSFFRDQEAMNIAIESLVLPQDDYLSYVFRETMQTLSRRVPVVTAGGASGSARPLVTLIESGRLPENRVGDAVGMLLQRGGPEELGWLFAEFREPKKLAGSQRSTIAAGLLQAAVERGIKPAADLASLRPLLEGPDRGLQIPAITLAAAWRENSMIPALQTLAAGERAGGEPQRQAILALATLGTPEAKATIETLCATDRPEPVRLFAIAALARIDTAAAAARAAEVLATVPAAPSTTEGKLPTQMLDALLDRRDGPAKLAAAIEARPPSADVAKMFLRHMYATGRTEPAVADTLTKAAGIAANPPPPSQEEIVKLAAEVVAKGDPARGEAVFRRTDIACMKCHAVAKAGGNIGPELSAVGSISPPEYVVASILNPDASIKEAYVTRNVITDSGEVHTGILVDRDELRVRLRDATGKVITIPTAEIEEEVEGKSLMPKGLTTFLTQQEFLDLARFVSELGKPGPYAIRSTPTIQRWKLLDNPPADLAKGGADVIPADELFEKFVLKGPGLRWKSAYGKTAGGLPLDEFVAHSGSGLQPLWLQGEISLDAAGPLDLRITAPEGTVAWIGGTRIDLAKTGSVPLEKGSNRLTLRVPATSGTGQEVKVEVHKTKESPRRVEVAGGS
jgi:putative heme-binding domain-containing protein